MFNQPNYALIISVTSANQFLMEKILLFNKRHKSRLSHVNVFYAIMEDN